MPNKFRTLDGRIWEPRQSPLLTLADGTRIEGMWAGSAKNEKLDWWAGKPGNDLTQSQEIAAVATKSDDTEELLWLDAPPGARLFFVIEARETGKDYRRALMVTVPATPTQVAYLHHDRFSLFGRFRPDGSIESIAPLEPPPPRVPAQGELF